ncbi:hypothetical protein [Angustibacter luteus]|uniref:Uncharacterized protein n=1 Tax=Angustibacter luteus TaxID=658456 RepID=A0ABW1JDH1_9ACTN
MSKRKDFRAEQQELQRLLARELAEYGPHPLGPKDADRVAWHLADVTLAVVIEAVKTAEAPSTG